MSRAARGLYAGRHIQFGNSISFSKRQCVLLPATTTTTATKPR